jgi:sugar fermentation stimulation protein A
MPTRRPDLLGTGLPDLVPGTFLRRYKRFFADVRLADGSVVVAHVPNTGSMRTLLNEGSPAWLTPAADSARKLRWTLTLLGTPDGGMALIDTGLPNRLVADAVAAGRIPELAGYATCRREVAYGTRGSRCDLWLEDPTRPPCVVEIKNVTMAADGKAQRADFPDSPTERGRKHLAELADCARAGQRAVQFYLLGRTDRQEVGIAHEIDPVYAAALRDALAAGVEVLCYSVTLSPGRVALEGRCAFTPP